MYIKDKALKDSVRSLVDSELTKSQFEELKNRIETGHKNRYDIIVSIYPLKGNYARIEIERERRRSKRRYNWRNYDNWDDFTWFESPDDTDFDYDNGTSRFLFPISRNGRDQVLVGAEMSFEQNFYRGFAGIRFEHFSEAGSIFRIGAGTYKEGVFQLSYTTSDEGSLLTMSRGRWNKNLHITPAHIIGQNFLDFSAAHVEYLTENHGFRVNFGYKKEKSSLPDSVHSEKANIYGLKADYSLAYLDDNTLPMSGVYFNAKGQKLMVDSDFDDTPFNLTNKYTNWFKKYGTYNNSVYGNLHVLLPITKNNSLHVSAQAVKEEFDIANYNKSLTSVPTLINFSKQERSMFSPKVGLRHSMGESSILELTGGYNKTELKGLYNADWEEYYIEGKIISGGIFEIKYTYTFNQSINVHQGSDFIPSLVHNTEGAVLTLGFNIGSLN